MTPQEFIAKWQAVQLSERSACQQHFLDLCELLGHEKPAAADPEGAWYTFERGVDKVAGGQGWADVWMRGRFGWEYKKKRRDLAAAYRQLLDYREALENPPLLVVCDLDRFEIHTNFPNTKKNVYAFDLAGLADSANLQILRQVFTDPDALHPTRWAERVTADAAEQIAEIAQRLQARGHEPHAVAHFLMKLMFCMFAEDIGLLGNRLFTQVLVAVSRGGSAGLPAGDAGARLAKMLASLFEAMQHGGSFGVEQILHFNGGLFADAQVFELEPEEIRRLIAVNELDWSEVEPAVFGTLFERSLDPAKRSQIGAHYTSREDIETLVRPVILAPLRREWEEVRGRCEKLTAEIERAKAEGTKTKKRKQREEALLDFLHRLGKATVLDPACGSGNFLYVSLHLLLDLEKEVRDYAARLFTPPFPDVHPTQLLGLEINPFAAELASVVIWIGYLQWKQRRAEKHELDPVLRRIDTIRCQDAILDLSDPENPREPEWPAAEFIVGNPPFLGDKKMRAELGDRYVTSLRRRYSDRLPGQLDLCCYWFERTRSQIERGRVRRAGLLATQGIRGGNNRTVLERISETGRIFWAESDRKWILDGAVVHVSMAAFDGGGGDPCILDGHEVESIHANLRAGTTVDVNKARPLEANCRLCYLGVMKAGPFDLSEAEAIRMIETPNAHSLTNSDVLRPRVTARDLLQRRSLGWIVDFGCDMPRQLAARYETPWKHVEEKVRPIRELNRRPRLAKLWWIHGEARPGLRQELDLHCDGRFIVTPEVSKHRIFTWLDIAFLADHQTRAFPRSDDYFFGVLHSRPHEVWSRSMGTQLREKESGFRYTPTTCFETFPFPEPTAGQREEIAAAARELDVLRNAWLNPPEWVRTETLEFPGTVGGPWSRYIDEATIREVTPPLGETLRLGTVRYPRLVPANAEAAAKLKKRTLTNLYNQRPAWLDQLHRRLDAAVFAAYGWPSDLSDDDLLARLLALNLERAAAES